MATLTNPRQNEDNSIYHIASAKSTLLVFFISITSKSSVAPHRLKVIIPKNSYKYQLHSINKGVAAGLALSSQPRLGSLLPHCRQFGVTSCLGLPQLLLLVFVELCQPLHAFSIDPVSRLGPQTLLLALRRLRRLGAV